MTDQLKQKVVSVTGFCGGGVFLILNITTGAVPGGFVGGILGFLIFGGIAAFIVYVLVPKDKTADSAGSGTKTGTTQENNQPPNQ